MTPTGSEAVLRDRYILRGRGSVLLLAGLSLTRRRGLGCHRLRGFGFLRLRILRIVFWLRVHPVF